jgi:hypothetical protein
MGPAICNPRAASLAEWRVDTIERAVRPTDAQRAVFNELKAASAKAAELIAAACPRDFPETSTARLESMEKRLDAMLERSRPCVRLRRVLRDPDRRAEGGAQ